MIHIEGITRTYSVEGQHIPALAGVDLHIGRGEHVAITGASGSGKSTLLNILGCLDQPSAGRYRLEDADVSALDDDALSELRNRRIGFVFQSFHLLPRMTVLENVMQPLVYRGMPRSERKVLATRALEQVGLGSRMGHRPNQLSGGQRQRVAVARALVKSPRLVIADEPTASLDSRTADQVLDLMRERGHAQGAAFLIATHDSRLLGRCDRVVALLDGRIVEGAAS